MFGATNMISTEDAAMKVRPVLVYANGKHISVSVGERISTKFEEFH